MIRILFLCHGNICRSPMAEFIMKDLVKKAGLEQSIQIESAATSTEEIGNPVYPPARRKLSEHGIDCSGKRARQLLNSDYEKYDLLIGMDRANLRSMYRICGGDFADKMHLLMDFTDRPGEVADPWYTDDFDTTWRDVEEGCRGLLRHTATPRGRRFWKTSASGRERRKAASIKASGIGGTPPKRLVSLRMEISHCLRPSLFAFTLPYTAPKRKDLLMKVK